MKNLTISLFLIIILSKCYNTNNKRKLKASYIPKRNITEIKKNQVYYSDILKKITKIIFINKKQKKFVGFKKQLFDFKFYILAEMADSSEIKNIDIISDSLFKLHKWGINYIKNPSIMIIEFKNNKITGEKLLKLKNKMKSPSAPVTYFKAGFLSYIEKDKLYFILVADCGSKNYNLIKEIIRNKIIKDDCIISRCGGRIEN